MDDTSSGSGQPPSEPGDEAVLDAGNLASLRLLDGRLKLRHLLLVDALTARRSVVGAAATLQLSQPSVTRSLQELEQVLGFHLYTRHARGLEPTEYGIAFTHHARSVLAQLEQAHRHLAEIGDGSRGQVVVGTQLAGSNLLLPRAIAHFKRRHPRVRIVVRDGSPAHLLEELTVGWVDMIVGRMGGPTPEGATYKGLYHEPVRIFTRRGHPLAGTTSLADLSTSSWILPSEENALRIELEKFFHRNGLELPDDRVEATAFLTVRQLLIETDMLAVLPVLIGSVDPQLAPLPIEIDHIADHVGLTLAVGRQLNPACTSMISALVDVSQHFLDDLGGAGRTRG